MGVRRLRAADGTVLSDDRADRLLRESRVQRYEATGRRIVLLTVFVKTRQREHREVQRAWSAMQTCIAEGHTVEEAE